MKKKRKEKLTTFLYLISYLVIFAIVIAFIIFEVYLWMTYGNKPIEEIPLWVLWFLWGR